MKEVTEGSGNVFTDLGFPEDEAKELAAKAEAERTGYKRKQRIIKLAWHFHRRGIAVAKNEGPNRQTRRNPEYQKLLRAKEGKRDELEPVNMDIESGNK